MSVQTVQTLPHGIHMIDTGFHRPHFDAAYLVVEQGRGAFIDTGTNFGVPRLLAALDFAGLDVDAVDWLIVTHVHLDHAGGAGLLLQSLPNARFVVHPRGARHMIDPSALYEGARAVYGDEAMAASYGTIVPVPAQRVVQTCDGMTLELAGRPLMFIDTPGHARHHHCIWDAASRGFFTGDTFGISYREFDTDRGAFAMLTTTPVQFEPPKLRESIERMLSFEPQWMYLTHFGRIGEVPRMAAQLFEQIDAMVEIGRVAPHGEARHAALKQDLARLYLERLRAHGVTLPDAALLDLLAIDIELNAKGLAIWLDRDHSSRREQT